MKETIVIATFCILAVSAAALLAALIGVGIPFLFLLVYENFFESVGVFALLVLCCVGLVTLYKEINNE